MEENKKAVENENEEISEENLEEVAGGDDDDSMGTKCYFQPEKPFKYIKENRVPWVKCRSDCFGLVGSLCKCHGSTFCKDKYHMMEQDSGNPQRWHPTKVRERNHHEWTKTVEPLDPK